MRFWILIVVGYLGSVLFGLYVESLTYIQLKSVVIGLGAAGIWWCVFVNLSRLLSSWPFKRVVEATDDAKR